MNEVGKLKFYQKTWFLWVMLIFFAPVGILMLWIQQKYSKNIRIVLSVVFGVFFLIAMINRNDDDSKIANDTNVEIASNENDTVVSVENKDETTSSNEGTVEVPDVIGESLSSAIGILEMVNISNIEKMTIDEDKIRDEEGWVVIEQSVSSGQKISASDSITLVCKSQADTEAELVAEKNAKLEETFPVEYAKRAAVVAMTNGCATDVFDDTGNNYDVAKFHSYSDTSGNFYDYYIIVDSIGEWMAKDDNTWHVESILLRNFLSTEIVASMDVRFDGNNYVVENVEGSLGMSDLALFLEYSDALYLSVPLELIEEDRVSNRLDTHQSWVDDQFSLWDGSHKVLKDLILDNLNDEKSFDHIETTYIEIFNEDYRDEINVILDAANISRRVEIGDLWITTEFTAKNAFNATIKSSAFGIASFSENQVILVAIE